jgi:hypothetical protein
MSKWKHRISDVNTETREAFCSACGRVKVSMKDGHWICNIARKERRGKHNAEKHRAINARSSIKCGIGFAHLRGDRCEICGITENLCGDHNHATGKFRGTLCRGCNFGVGFFKDQIALLSKAILYLSK